jgi:hypothetical protein
LKPLENRIKLKWTDNLSFEEILNSGATLPPHSAIYWHNLSVDAAGVGHEGGTALARLYAVANAPIFSYDDSYFGRELLGGPMQSAAEGGQRIASVAVRILGGEKAGDIKTPVSQFSTPKYDWRELQRCPAPGGGPGWQAEGDSSHGPKNLLCYGRDDFRADSAGAPRPDLFGLVNRH